MKSPETETGPIPEVDLPAAVERCRSDPDLMTGLRAVYDQADRAGQRAGRACMAGGMCCKFDLFDHRLYLSLAELALLTIEPPPRPQRARQRRCPYQVGPDCTAYSRRPLGCRAFSCSAAGGSQSAPLYEFLHRQIRQLHQSHCHPYAYAELCRYIMQLHSSK